LIPHFPDDPKARFLSELDEEIPDALLSQSSQSFSQNSSATLTSPKKRGTGMWKSVKTLEQFWEMMAYRQECCSGRLVGFIWVVFTPGSLLVNGSVDTDDDPPSPTIRKASNAATPDLHLTKKRKSPVPEDVPSMKRRKHKHTPILTGAIHPRVPHIKSPTTSSSFGSMATPSSSFSQTTQPETTPYYHAPHDSRGTIILPQKEYDRVHEILLRQDFSSLSDSRESTKTWIEQTGIVAGARGRSWGIDVIGRKNMPDPTMSVEGEHRGETKVNVLQVKKQDKSGAVVDVVAGAEAQTLPAMLVRKKAKAPDEVANAQPAATAALATGVKTLNAGLVRKKPKA